MAYRMYYRSQLPKVVDFEREVMPRWDAVHFVTEVDAEAVRRHAATARIAVVPNGVDVGWYAPPEPRPTTVEPEVVFTGAMFGPLNVDAAVFFHREEQPLVRAKRPEVQFVVAGRDPSPSVRALDQADQHTTVASAPVRVMSAISWPAWRWQARRGGSSPTSPLPRFGQHP